MELLLECNRSVAIFGSNKVAVEREYGMCAGEEVISALVPYNKPNRAVKRWEVVKKAIRALTVL
jgi:hypothetical protein